MMRVLGAAALVLLAALPARSEPSPAGFQAFVDRVADDYVRPAAAGFADATAELSGTLGALCGDPGAATLDAARHSFRAVVEAWAPLGFLTLDPLEDAYRSPRVLYWPDPRGMTLKQVQGVLAKQEPDATDPEALSHKSVAVQGLGALEFVLFGTGSDGLAEPGDDYRCRYATAIARNLQTIGEELETAFAPESEFSGWLSAPSDDNPLYQDPGEAVSDLVADVAVGIENVRDRMILPALGETPADANGKLVPFWRSGAARIYLETMLKGMERLLEVGGVAGIVSAEHAWLAESIAFEFDTSESEIAKLDRPIDEAVEDEASRELLKALRFSLANQRDLVALQLIAATGLEAGVNALDGD